ncbi:ankyrin repeat domain-containing protein 61-like [Gadus chalcogrammus]|uniref:ankyrin repeat domain-containing protein 61-like n=1 Tax=Gadus chalcogrammus TaxID=1042646 RepID=UPI0024C49982|nr:ankyrin repeat domain-containing protein 61-like [Gadus chalcogrammus]
MAQDMQRNGYSFTPGHGTLVGISIRDEDPDRSSERDSEGYAALHSAILTWGHHLRIWPKPNPGFKTTLSDVFARDELCLCRLCDQGVNINARSGDSSSQTALHLAVRYGVLPAVAILASYGADVNAEDSSGMTPLHVASGTLQKDIVSSLIKLGADINAVSRWTGNTPLHLATTAVAVRDHRGPASTGLGCVAELLRHGADPDVANRADLTPLQEACVHGQEELVDMLLSHGADLNRRTGAGEGCLLLFLDRPVNVRRAGSLLSKLLCLTRPSGLSVRDAGGRLPAALTRPCYAAQRGRLLALSRRPKSLKDLCKNRVYLSPAHAGRVRLRDVLPDAIFDFVFNRWEAPGDVSFSMEEDDGECLG